MAEQPAPVKQLRPLDVAQATRGLFACCASGDATALLQLLDTCVLVDHTAKQLDDCQPVSADLRRDEDGATALLVACEGGHVECTNLLIQRGCPPGKASRTGRTPVMAASFHGHPDCLKLLLAARASPYDGTMQDDKGSERTPLVLALDRFSTTGDDTCVKQLLRADERLRAAPAAGGAGGGADAAAARALRAEADAYYASALVTSCGSGLTEGVRLLLQARATLPHRQPLRTATPPHRRPLRRSSRAR